MEPVASYSAVPIYALSLTWWINMILFKIEMWLKCEMLAI